MMRYWSYLIGIVVYLCLNSIQGKVTFAQRQYEPRVFYGAHIGTYILTVYASDKDKPTTIYKYKLLDGKDKDVFDIDKYNGIIITKENITRSIGSSYEIIVVALLPGSTAFDNIQIIVSSYNNFPPVFLNYNYTVYNSRFTPIDNTVLVVQALDEDDVDYNAKIIYSIEEKGFQINLDTGEIKLLQQFNTRVKQVQFQVTAQDTGSPPRKDITNVTVVVKTISEPQNITIERSSPFTANLCWLKPMYGEPHGYIVEYWKQQNGTIKPQQKNFTSLNDNICVSIHNLTAWTSYNFYISGWDNEEVGLRSEVQVFKTIPNYCDHKPCKSGKCELVTESPGYKCFCELGYYGSICDLFNPCFFKPCQNNATCQNTSDNDYICQCMDGFFDANCSSFNPCILNTTHCMNGGVCYNTSNQTYSCECKSGYFGQQCEAFNPCYSNPCEHDGVCYNTGISNYSCNCLSSYQGDYCQEERNECKLMPCLNGGICIDGQNNFTCHCLPGFIGQICEEKESCISEITVDDKGTFKWESAYSGENVHLPCPYGSTYDGYIYRYCIIFQNGTVGWSKPETATCNTQEFLKAGSTLMEIQNLTSNVNDLSPTQISRAVNKLEKVLLVALEDQQIAKRMFDVLSRLLNVNESVLHSSNSATGATDKIVNIINTYASDVKIETGANLSLFTGNVHVFASVLDNGTDDPIGYKFSPTYFSPKKNSNIHKPNYLLEENEEQNIPSIMLPKEAFSQAAQQLECVRLHFVAYRNSRLFQTKTTNMSNISFDSPVLSAKFVNTSIQNLTEPITYVMRPQNMIGNYVCVYWNTNENIWSTDGIETSWKNNSVICKSSHLTGFSILLDIYPDQSVSSEHDQAMTIISYIGSALSVLGLSFTILTYSLFRCLNRDRSGKILICISLSMLMMNIAFIVGSQRHFVSGVQVCMGVAVLIHYFTLSTLLWMCVEAINMYRMLVLVFASSESYFMLKRSTFAWGIPLVPVTTVLAIDVNYYNSYTQDCRLSPDNPYVYYFSFLGPCCIILLINLIIFIIITRVLLRPKIDGKIGSLPTIGKAQVRGALTVMVLLGITWVFGLFAIGSAKLVFQYIFCICNSLQGFLIFAIRCLYYPEARAAWIQLFKTGTLKKTRGRVRKDKSQDYSSSCQVHRNENISKSTFINNSSSNQINQNLISMQNRKNTAQSKGEIQGENHLMKNINTNFRNMNI